MNLRAGVLTFIACLLWLGGDMTVYVTNSGKKYHLESCKWGNKPLALAKAREAYTPCAVCKPPK